MYIGHSGFSPTSMFRRICAGKFIEFSIANKKIEKFYEFSYLYCQRRKFVIVKSTTPHILNVGGKQKTGTEIIL